MSENTPYENLAIAIVAKAVDDYIEGEIDFYTLKRFITSEYGQTLTMGLDSEFILNECKVRCAEKKGGYK